MPTRNKKVLWFLMLGWMTSVIYFAIALAPQTPSAQPTPEPTIAVAPSSTPCEHLYNSALGNSALGKVVYVFDQDAADSPSKCTGACAAKWPPLLVPSSVKPVIVTPAKEELGGSVGYEDRIQLTYGNHRLYTFNGDTTLDETKGNCVKDEGGTFQLLKADGTACPCDTPVPLPAPVPAPAPPPTPTSSCGGYYVCGWTPGWRCYDPYPFLSQCRSECCNNEYDFSCPGSNFCGGSGCTGNTQCGWTKGWRCYLPPGGCAPFDKYCLSQCGCYDANDSSCSGFFY